MFEERQDFQGDHEASSVEGPTETQIMVQVPVAMQLPQVAELWSEMQEELELPVSDEAKKAYEKQLRVWHMDPSVFMLSGMRMLGDARAGQLVAFMVAVMHEGPPRHGRIVDLYVQPSLRGNNLARNMVEAASGWLKAQGCAFLEAGTLTRNRPGMAFLASLQFQLYSSVLRKPL